MQRLRTICCCSCRRPLLAKALFRAQAPRLPPWQLQARTAISSASASRPDPASHHSVDDYVPSIDAAAPEGRKTSGREAPAQNQDPTKPRFRGLNRWKSTNRRVTVTKGKSLEIFERVVRQQVEEDTPRKSAPQSPAALQYYNDLVQLKPMLKTQNIETCLEFFLTRLWNNVPFEDRNNMMKQRGASLMTKVVKAKMADWDNERLPTLAQATQIFHELNSLSCKKWTDAVMSLIGHLVTRSSTEADYPDVEAYERSMIKKNALLHDLIDAWIVFHRHRLSLNKYGDSVTQEFRFPELDEELLQRYAKSGHLPKAINIMFPQLWGNDFKDIPMVAIATFVVLADPVAPSPEVQKKAKPLLEPLGKILATVPVWKAGLESIFAEHQDVLLYVLARWDFLFSRLRQIARPKRHQLKITSEPEVEPEAKLEAKQWAISEVNFHGVPSKYIMHDINTALGMGDVDAVEAAWARTLRHEAIFNQDQKVEVEPDAKTKLFHHFIMAFTALHRPQRAVEVWDYMTGSGIQPSIKTWTSLIEGCRRSKNAVGIENVWKKLLASGLEVDNEAWSARVAGLIDCGEPEAGLRALYEMQHQSKLTIAPINAAVAALIRMNATSAARKVLDWAAQNHIDPDIVTFNMLLRPLVMEGNAASIDSLLKTMREKHVNPDTATFTVLLEGLIGNSKDADPAEQVNTVKELFNKMEAAGVQANMLTFARMIHILLSEPGANSYGAVEAIRKYILSKGLTVTPQIHTILVNHYLSLDPPNLDAVDDLVNRDELNWRTLMRCGLDRVFWERVIKGYATAGRVDTAYEIFEQVSNIGSAMTLDTLLILLRSLVNAGKMEEARRAVEITKRHRQNSPVTQPGQSFALYRHREKSRYWRHGFWVSAVEYGLLSPAEWKQLELGITSGAAAS